MIPSVGRIVHLKLSDGCAANINKRRLMGGGDFIGNTVIGGDVFPMIITKLFTNEPTEKTAVNGQVFLDGNDLYWATSVLQGTEKGQWHSPIGE